jgi:hypothetical protein
MWNKIKVTGYRYLRAACLYVIIKSLKNMTTETKALRKKVSTDIAD